MTPDALPAAPLTPAQLDAIPRRSERAVADLDASAVYPCAAMAVAQEEAPLDAPAPPAGEKTT